MHLLRKYKILFFFVYLSIWASLASTPLTEFFRPSAMLSRLYSLLLYLPFALVIFWKLIQDIRKFHVNIVNILYYVFAVYYCCLCVYRFVNGMEVQESIYYSVVLFGSLAIYCQIRERRLKMDAQSYHFNFMAILIYMICYKIIASILSTSFYGSPRLIGNPPINNLYSTSMLVMLMPFLIDSISNQAQRKSTFGCVILSLSLILVVTCSSRAIFLLAFALFFGLAVIRIDNKRLMIKLLACICCVVFIVGLMAATDFGTVRYALYRELGLFYRNNESQPSDLPTDPSTTIAPDDEVIALEQIDRSDSMRSELVKLGLEQIKQNPLFGTGDLYYTYDLGYMKLDQTSHNFILESLISYGILGTLMILALFIAILAESKILCKTMLHSWRFRVSTLGLMIYYFAFGLVQPSVYNTLLCPLFILVLAYSENTLSNESSPTIKSQE